MLLYSIILHTYSSAAELASSPASSPGKAQFNDPNAMEELQSMMVSIQMAKEEALKHGSDDSSREKLINDIHYLHSLLVKARDERKDMSAKVRKLVRKRIYRNLPCICIS